jgi:ubiquitin-conjugating enzyme E2 S
VSAASTTLNGFRKSFFADLLEISIMATENLAPQTVSRLLGEIRQLNRNPPEGVKYLENDENSVSEIHALINGPEGTPFVGGSFRLKLVVSSDYPNSPPKGFFLTKIFHPNVANNGDICVNTLKKDWTPDVTISHVFQVIRCLLIVPFPESSLNDEAGKMFMESYDEYAARARIVTEVHALPSTKDGMDVAEDAAPSGENAQKKKEKDAKKKNLRRL